MTSAFVNPRITIGITSFDRFDLLIESINSIREQVFSDYNVIIANDNPSRKLDASSLGISDDPRFRVINHETNLGEIQTLNSLLNLAETEYFTWLSDDDLFHPLFLREALIELDRNAEAVAFYSSYSTGRYWQPELIEVNHNQNTRIFDKVTLLPNYASRAIRLIGCYGVFRRTAILATGGFHQLGSGFSPYADTVLPILMTSQGKILYNETKYVFLRIHEASLSNSSRELESYVSAQLEFINVVSSFLDETLEIDSYKVHCDFFNWFSRDRAEVIGRNPGLILPLFIQFKQDMAFLNRLEINVSGKLALLPTLLKRFCMTARRLLNSKIAKLHS